MRIGNTQKDGQKKKDGIKRWNIDWVFSTRRKMIRARSRVRRLRAISTASRLSCIRFIAQPLWSARDWWHRLKTRKWESKFIFPVTIATRWLALLNWLACRPAVGAHPPRSARASSARTSPTSPTIEFCESPLLVAKLADVLYSPARPVSPYAAPAPSPSVNRPGNGPNRYPVAKVT